MRQVLQFELNLSGGAERIYEVLPHEAKILCNKATEALGDHLKPAGQKALSSIQLLLVQAFENLFEKSCGCQFGIEFKVTMKCVLSVQG